MDLSRYRNEVASGGLFRIDPNYDKDPKLPRYGTDRDRLRPIYIETQSDIYRDPVRPIYIRPITIEKIMSGILWQLEHSVEAEVTPESAWKYRTDIVSWNDPPAKFVLDGPFIAGSRGTTLLPEQEPLHWIIREVEPPGSFVIEMELDGAMLTFKWSFDALSQHRTRMTQKIVLAGENAQTYLQQVEPGISSSLADGMRRIAADMAAAERGTEGNH